MKNPAAYYLLLIYLFALCKPVVPLMQDIIAHTFFEHQHVATVHKDGGNNHVISEVGKLTKEDTSNKSGGLISYDKVPQHLVAVFEWNLSSNHSILIHNSHSPDYFFPLISLAIQLPPPRV